ncbi:MAG: serine/threonine-protein phosphatase, partial [Holophagales bacterium]|nr:serine/threonine-protein phosphatase [Holophagales bacterium]
YAELDHENHVLEYVSGGHNPALLHTADGIEELPSSGPIVGLISEARFRCRRVELPAGATLLVYTDGVTELENGDREELGTEALEEILGSDGWTSASGLTGSIHRRMRQFAGRDQFDDDATLLVVRRAPDPQQGTEAMPVPSQGS